jgi:hypothetical protein
MARKPRDIDAELKALQDKAKALKARRIVQLGELVVATGADSLDIEALAGVLMEAAEGAKQPETQEGWRRRGAAFFQRRSARRPTRSAGDVRESGTPDSDRASAG